MLTQTLKRSLILLLIPILVLMIALVSAASSGISVNINGQRLETDVDPIILDGRTMVPLRAIFEALGAEVQWEGDTEKITGKKGDTTVVLYLNNRVAQINGLPENLEVPPTLINNRTMVPARFIAESFGANVKWDERTKTVDVTTNSETFIPMNSDAPALNGKAITLLRPVYKGTVSVEEAIANRISRRRFSEEPISKQDLSQILWAAYGVRAVGIDGVTGATRTVPSAAGRYPLEIFVIIGELHEDILPAGIYRFDPPNHQIVPISQGDQRNAMAQAAPQYDFIKQAPVNIVLAAILGGRGERFVYMDVGHVTQNVHLQAEALGLGSVAVGGFETDKLKVLLKTDLEPIMIIPIGNI